jgi:regulator of RNase E activity RraA
MTNPPSLTNAQLEYLISVDSPTIANAIERLNVRDRSIGYIGAQAQCVFPELGTMVGRALTVRMSNARGGPGAQDGYWKLWETLDAFEGPAVIVMADSSGTPARVAYAGEIMARLAQRLGAVGMVTDGALRDLDEVRSIGFHYFMQYPVVSHANFEVLSVGDPVDIGGERIATGDLLHGDRNGIVVIPDDVLDRLPAAVEAVRAAEASDMALIASTDFTLDQYKKHRNYGG